MKLGGWARIGVLASVAWISGCVILGRVGEPLRYLGARVEIITMRFAAPALPDRDLTYTDPEAATKFRPWEHLKGLERAYSDRFVEANSLRDIEHIRRQLEAEKRTMERVNEDRALDQAVTLVGPVLAGWFLGWVILYPGRRLTASLVRWIMDGFKSN